MKYFNISKTWNHICKYFEECTASSSIHGVKFIGDTKRTFVERLLWLIMCTISVVICLNYIMQTYEKWESSPVFVTIGTVQIPIHEIAFPAVTICPEIKSERDKFYYTDALFNAHSNTSNITEEEQYQFECMSMVCNRSITERGILKINKFGEDFFNFFHNITPNFNDTFIKCEFSGNPFDCSELFTPIFTKDGICYSFNILDRSELFQDNIQYFMDYNKARNSSCFETPLTSECQDPYPRRSSFSGVESGLQVELKAKSYDLDFKCASALQGFKVILHDPSEIPNRNHNNFRVPLDEAVFAAVTPNVIITKEDLRIYPSHQRKCYFNDEKSLIRFKHYSEANCEVECFTYLIASTLECLDFYLPHTNETDSICGGAFLPEIRFLEKILPSYISNTTELNLSEEQLFIKLLLYEFNITTDVHNHCDCLPSCSSTEYAFETTQTQYFWRSFQIKDRDSLYEEYRSSLAVYFQNAHFIPLQRKEMFGAMDFIAYTGGLLGLFIGFSFLSLAEIIYFLTLRIGCNLHIYGKKLWHGNEK